MNYTEQSIKIIKGQYLTEKSNQLAEKKIITLNVDVKSNKTIIKNTIENFFNVKVKAVRIINVKGKLVKFKSIQGKTKKWKKAIIILKKGYDINFSEYKI
ncbi:MAG TPA: 50S ribosomal protein L23 [Candidatus Azoamicus sp. MARI]